jgi:hypothetical protein
MKSVHKQAHFEELKRNFGKLKALSDFLDKEMKEIKIIQSKY